MCSGLLDHCIAYRRSDPVASDVWKNIGYWLVFSLSPGGGTVSASAYAQLPIADTVAQQDVRMWIAGKRYIPQQKSPR